jgi:predicted nucleic acid-binding protein
MAIVADTGGIFALYDAKDRYHQAVSNSLRLGPERIHLPSPLLGELGYVLLRWLGNEALLQFLVDIEANAFHIEPFLTEDMRRCRALIEKYSDLGLGLCDAAVVATAERLGTNRILTVDERDFRVIRSRLGEPFVLLPADLSKGKRRG